MPGGGPDTLPRTEMSDVWVFDTFQKSSTSSPVRQSMCSSNDLHDCLVQNVTLSCDMSCAGGAQTRFRGRRRAMCGFCASSCTTGVTATPHTSCLPSARPSAQCLSRSASWRCAPCADIAKLTSGILLDICYPCGYQGDICHAVHHGGALSRLTKVLL